MEVLPEHAASSSLDFTCDFASGKNFARVPTDTNYAADDRLTRSVACAVAEHDVDEGEAALVTRALREAATFAGSATPLMHLLCSCYCPVAALQPALVEASRNGHVDGVRLLLDARAAPAAQPDGKTALHVAVEAGHEDVARVLVRRGPTALRAPSSALGGRTPLDVARDNDQAALARRLEALAGES